MPQVLPRILQPRPSFPFAMREAEREAMARQGTYWDDLTERGTCLIFAADPAVASHACTARVAPVHVARMRAERT